MGKISTNNLELTDGKSVASATLALKSPLLSISQHLAPHPRPLAHMWPKAFLLQARTLHKKTKLSAWLTNKLTFPRGYLKTQPIVPLYLTVVKLF